VNQGAFLSQLQVQLRFTKKIAGGIEYYGSLGPVTGFDAIKPTAQQILPAIDLNLSPSGKSILGSVWV